MNVRGANALAIPPYMVSATRKRTITGATAAVNEATPGGRLRALRVAENTSQLEMAEVLGVERPQISKYENNLHAMPDYIVERAAQLFGVTPAFIRYGDTDSRMAKVVGLVGAGATIAAVEQPPFRYVEVPASWSDAVALQVSGLSCYPIYDDGDDIVIRGEQRLIDEEILGKMCVVETSDGIGMVKRVRRGSAPGLYTLESTNAPTIEDVPLRSARAVRLHLPK